MIEVSRKTVNPPGLSSDIHFMEPAELPQAVALLSRAFNMKTAAVNRELQSVLNGEAPYRAALFTASVNNELAGIVECYAYPKDEGRGVYGLSHLAVAESLRRRHIGRSLMIHAERYIAESCLKGRKGLVFLFDETKLKNPRSHFYERLGYRIQSNRHAGAAPMMVKPLNFG